MLLVHGSLDATACARRPFEPWGGTATTLWHLIDGWHDKRTGWLGKGSGQGGRLGRSSRRARPTVIVCTDIQERTTEGQQPAGNRADAPQEQTSGPVPDTLRRIGQRSWWEATPSPSRRRGPQVAQFLLAAAWGWGSPNRWQRRPSPTVGNTGGFRGRVAHLPPQWGYGAKNASWPGACWRPIARRAPTHWPTGTAAVGPATPSPTPRQLRWCSWPTPPTGEPIRPTSPSSLRAQAAAAPASAGERCTAS